MFFHIFLLLQKQQTCIGIFLNSSCQTRGPWSSVMYPSHSNTRICSRLSENHKTLFRNVISLQKIRIQFVDFWVPILWLLLIAIHVSF